MVGEECVAWRSRFNRRNQLALRAGGRTELAKTNLGRGTVPELSRQDSRILNVRMWEDWSRPMSIVRRDV